MIVLGLDPGSIRLGYGAISVEGNRLELIECGLIVVPKGWSLQRRLGAIGADLEDLFSQGCRKYIDAETAIEKGFHVARGEHETLAQVRGVCIYMARSWTEKDPALYTPKTVKKCAAGSGKATKEQVARMVKMRLGMKREPEPDAADALAVAITHAMRRGA